MSPPIMLCWTKHPSTDGIQERALKENKIFVSAFDDPYIIAGQVCAYNSMHASNVLALDASSCAPGDMNPGSYCSDAEVVTRRTSGKSAAHADA